jgi:glycosyltransferase involved in cell wall biosynthesis
MPTHATPLNILHVVDSLEFGGLERVVTELAQAQKDHGHRVTVFSINTTDGLTPELQAAGIEVVVGHKSRSLDVNVLKQIRRLALDRPMDVVHAHNFVPNYYAAVAMLGSLKAPPLVSTCHDMGDRLSNRRLRWIYRLSLLRTRRVAMVGQQVHDRYVASGMVRADAAQTVLNGVPVHRFIGSPQRRASARATLGLAPDLPVMACVGRLVELKNQSLMIECMPHLLHRHPSLRLLVIGEGPLDAELRALARARGVNAQVDFLGRRSDVADLLPAMDIFALPSQTEGLSIALLEACATGLAVVASAVGGNPEIIHDGQTGLLVPANDQQALCEALQGLLDDTALRQRLGRQASSWVTEHGSIDALRATYDEFYRQAM